MEVRLNGRVYTCLEQLREQADEELFLFLEEWFDDRSYVLGHTSGSTGAPKEIQLSKADMRASARMTNAFFAIDRESVLLLCLSVSYIAGKCPPRNETSGMLSQPFGMPNSHAYFFSERKVTTLS